MRAGWSRPCRPWWLAGLVLLLLAACGGGGDGGSTGGPDDGAVRLVFDSSSVEASTIERVGTSLSTAFTVVTLGQRALYFAVDGLDEWVVQRTLTQLGPTRIGVTLGFSSRLPAGVRTGELRVRVCLDAACNQVVPGSEARLPVRLDVQPNIRIQVPEPMQRTGREPAPTQELALDFRPEMGTARLQTSGALQAFDIELRADRIVVRTRPLPAGRYEARIELSGSTRSGYFDAVNLSYTVLPPPGGELPLNVTPRRVQLDLVQGTVTTQRLRLQRPTWTDALDPPVISDNAVVREIRHLGGDDYEVTVDTRGVPLSPEPTNDLAEWFSTIGFRAGEWGGGVGVDFAIRISPPVVLEETQLDWLITSLSTAADLRRSVPVSTPDGVAVTWTARSSQPWLRVRRAEGITGLDPLELEVDPSLLSGTRFQQAELTLSLDRPGTLPRRVTVPLQNSLIRFDRAAPGVLIGSTGTVYIQGQVQHSGELRPGAGLLQVDGARLVDVRQEADPRFVAFVGLLAVDLADLVPGRPVTIRVNSALAPTQVVLPTATTPRVPSGHAALPWGPYRAASFSVRQQALVFAGADTLWRWPLLSAGWAAPNSTPLPQLLDTTFAADDTEVLALVGADEVVALDPVSLAPRRRGRLSGTSDKRFGNQVPAGAAALRLGRNGMAQVSIESLPPFPGRGVSWLQGEAGDIATGPRFPAPGADTPWPAGTVGVALARSSHGGAIAASPARGAARIYRGVVSQYVAGPVLDGQWIVALDDAGDRLVRNDGQLLFSGSVATLDLRRAVPEGHVAAGYAITGNGHFALVYGFRIASEPTGPRARDARLYLVDLRSGAAVLGQAPIVAAVVPLADAVGCTGPLAPGEACEHPAQITVAPGDASAFVLGPRGVAAVSLPEPPAGTRVRSANRSWMFRR
jgi:hypothetical protein